jgi:hypothetical protein
MRAVRDVLAIVFAGAFVGYVLAAVTAPLWNANVAGSSSEAPQARQFMVASLKQDPETLASVTESKDVAQKAARLLSTEQQAQVSPLSLTFLGGASEGRFQVDVYAVEMRVGGNTVFWPFALTLLNGRIVLVE